MCARQPLSPYNRPTVARRGSPATWSCRPLMTRRRLVTRIGRPLVWRRRPVAWRSPAGLAVSLVALVGLADPAGAAWQPPVGGEVTRPFDLGADPFEAGRHRGVDLAARPGGTVRAPCAGPVAFAGPAGTSGRVVTLRCGPWRVTHMPLASLAVRVGAVVGKGSPLGTVAASHDHAGLHVGVRREGSRFGYVDPLRFLAVGHPPVPPLGRAPRAPRRPSRPAPPTRSVPSRPSHEPRPTAAPRAVAPHPRPTSAPAVEPRPAAPGAGAVEPRLTAPGSAARRAGSNPGGGAPVAPWPVWLGLALVLAGVGVRLRGRPRRARAPVRAAGTVTR